MSKNLSFLSASSASMRVTFDFRFLDGTWNYPTCKTEGQRITNFGKTITCQEDQIFTSEKINILKQTFDKVKQYFQTYVKVKNPVSNPISILSVSGYYTLPENYYQSNSDLHLIILPDPTSTFIAAAAWTSLTVVDYRPITGIVLINPVDVDLNSTPAVDGNTEYFNTLYHELMHVLCFSDSLFKYWRDNDGKPYQFNNIIKSGSYKSKNFKVLSTPYIKKWLEFRFGIKQLTSNIPLGLELEDDGGSGTAGSHPEQTVYQSDVMCGIAYEGDRITELTYVAMLDSGWYVPDFRGATRLLWGWGPSFGASNLTSFLMEPYFNSFPNHYICKGNWDSKRCTWDYRGFGPCPGYEVDCNYSSNPQTKWCKGISFYDPSRTGRYPNLYTIDTFYIRPYSNGECWNPASGTTGAGQNAFCHIDSSGQPYCIDTLCNADGTLKLSLSGYSAKCTREGENVQLGSISVVCSNPVHICGIIKYDQRFDVESPFGFLEDLKLKRSVLDIFIIIAIVAFVVLIIYVIWYCFRKHRGDLEKKSTSSLV